MARTKTFVSRALTLVTDLDGTFLGGSKQDRRQLYNLIESNRESIGLLFVTGRSFKNVQPLFEQFHMPVPDCMICDVGTSIYRHDGTWLLSDLQEEIARKWGQGHALVDQALQTLEGLEHQELLGPYRKSYFYSSEHAALKGKAIVESLGFDGLLSDRKYFDVLPKGVNKGSTLIRVIQSLGIDGDSVLIAGDTLNDLSMLSLGLPAVAVGNSEPQLLAALEDSTFLYRASKPGAAGILEALDQHPLLRKLGL